MTVISDETLSLGAMELPRNGLTTSLDNEILLRHVEMHTRIHKLVSVMKMRHGASDLAVREFAIDARGFAVTSDEAATANLLAEVVRESPALGVSSRAATKPKSTAGSL